MSVYDETTAAIYRMAYKRLASGQSLQKVLLKLDNIKKTAWKNNEDIKRFIDNLKVELIELQCAVKNKTVFVRQYANKYLAEQSNSKQYDISDKYFNKVFSNCALPLHCKFYPLLRLEIFKILKEAK